MSSLISKSLVSLNSLGSSSKYQCLDKSRHVNSLKHGDFEEDASTNEEDRGYNSERIIRKNSRKSYGNSQASVMESEEDYEKTIQKNQCSKSYSNINQSEKRPRTKSWTKKSLFHSQTDISKSSSGSNTKVKRKSTSFGKPSTTFEDNDDFDYGQEDDFQMTNNDQSSNSNIQPIDTSKIFDEDMGMRGTTIYQNDENEIHFNAFWMEAIEHFQKMMLPKKTESMFYSLTSDVSMKTRDLLNIKEDSEVVLMAYTTIGQKCCVVFSSEGIHFSSSLNTGLLTYSEVQHSHISLDPNRVFVKFHTLSEEHTQKAVILAHTFGPKLRKFLIKCQTWVEEENN